MPESLNSFSNNAKIFCPFFKEQRDLSIRCEGMFIGTHSTKIVFKNKEAKNEHLYDYCINSKCYLGCPIAIAIQEKLELESELSENNK